MSVSPQLRLGCLFVCLFIFNMGFEVEFMLSQNYCFFSVLYQAPTALQVQPKAYQFHSTQRSQFSYHVCADLYIVDIVPILYIGLVGSSVKNKKFQNRNPKFWKRPKPTTLGKNKSRIAQVCVMLYDSNYKCDLLDILFPEHNQNHKGFNHKYLVLDLRI